MHADTPQGELAPPHQDDNGGARLAGREGEGGREAAEEFCKSFPLLRINSLAEYKQITAKI